MRVVVRFVFVLAVLVLICTGCEVSVSAATGGKLFYPNRVGKGDLGDPRRGMYDGSGYSERAGAGSSSGKFDGLRHEGGDR